MTGTITNGCIRAGAIAPCSDGYRITIPGEALAIAPQNKSRRTCLIWTRDTPTVNPY